MRTGIRIAIATALAAGVELHNYRYPEPLTQERILQKEEDAAQLAIGRLPTT